MEILFKAKREDTGEWVEGYPFPSIAGKELNRMTVFEPFPGGTSVNTYEIDSNTVCQYTGKTDRNGNRVFNNDILYDPHENERYIVFWDVESAGYVLKKDCICRSIDRVYYCGVIGNICDKGE